MRLIRALFVVLALAASTYAWGGARNTGGACSVTYPGSGSSNVSCTVTFSGGSAHDGFTRTSTKITNVAGGHTYFSLSGTFSNNCPVCMSSYGCSNYPIACYAVTHLNPNPDKKIITGCYNGGSPNQPNFEMMPSGVVTTKAPFIGNFPPNSEFGVVIDIIPGIGNTCTAQWIGLELDVYAPAKRSYSNETEAVVIPGYWP